MESSWQDMMANNLAYTLPKMQDLEAEVMLYNGQEMTVSRSCRAMQTYQNMSDFAR